MTKPETTAVVMTGRYKHHRPRDVVDLEAADLRIVLAGRRGRLLEDYLTKLGGGYWEVPLRDGTTKKIKGKKAARRELERDALRRT